MHSLFIMLILGFYLAGCSRPSMPEGKIPPTLALAFEKINLVKGDNEARDVLADRLVIQAVDYRDFKIAKERAVELSGAQRGQTLAMLAWEAANSGYDAQAKDFLQLAISDSWMITGSTKALRDAYLAGTEMRLGRDKEASQRIDSISDPRIKPLARSLGNFATFARSQDYAISDFKISGRDSVAPLTRALLYELDHTNVSRDKMATVLRAIEKMIADVEPFAATDCWSRLAVFEQKNGFLGEATLSANHAMQIAQAIDPRTEGYAIALKDAAIALLATGDRTEALKCLEYASAKPEIIAYFFQPEAMMAIAEGYDKAGDKEKANAFWLRAIKTAKGHPHPRARQINVVLLLSYMAKAGVSPSPEVMEVIDAIGRGEGGDAPLPPGYAKVGDTKTSAVKALGKQEKKNKKDLKEKKK